MYNATIDWCEENYTYLSTIAEPVNTFTNLAYLYYGVLGARNGLPGLRGSWGRACSACLVCIGLGSMWFHSTLSRNGQIADEVSMIVLLTCLSGLILKRPLFDKPLAILTTVAIFLYFFLPFYIFLGLYQISALYLIKELVSQVSKGIVHRELRRPTRYIVRGVSLFALSTVLWWADHLSCDVYPVSERRYLSTNILHLHAWWHLLSASSTYFVVKGLVSHDLEKVHPRR